jgi:hypothetical protein
MRNALRTLFTAFCEQQAPSQPFWLIGG